MTPGHWAQRPVEPRAFGPPPARGLLRAQLEDFRVVEWLEVPWSDDGEHLWLWVEKRGANTDWVAKGLARHLGVPPKAVGYAGRKDRHGVTQQWFSVPWSNRGEAALAGLALPGVEILSTRRHARKLKVGGLKGNRFAIVVRQVVGEDTAVEARLAQLGQMGVPNYFGDQRFGRDNHNLVACGAWFDGQLRVKDRNRRSLYLSAARAALFNRVCAERVAGGTWNGLLPGDFAVFDQSQAGFVVAAVDDALEQRLARREIHPSGPLWGRGDPATAGDVATLEAEQALAVAPLSRGLEAAGLRQERRALRLGIYDLTWHWQGRDLHLAFALTSGAFATAVLRELITASVGEEEGEGGGVRDR
ncbi:MAG: tRNA pseudouridine(13) synthase TruD [Candidatus Competibacterales bacterium]